MMAPILVITASLGKWNLLKGAITSTKGKCMNLLQKLYYGTVVCTFLS